VRRSPSEARRALFIGSTVINVTDIARATAFWMAPVGYIVRDECPAPDFVVTVPRRRWSNVSLCLTDKLNGN
jgi:hypothetical protein